MACFIRLVYYLISVGSVSPISQKGGTGPTKSATRPEEGTLQAVLIIFSRKSSALVGYFLRHINELSKTLTYFETVAYARGISVLQ